MPKSVNTIDLLGDAVVANLLIERTITEYNDNVITSIGACAFQECTELTSVTLSAVTSVGAGAFNQCTSLERIDFASVFNSTTNSFNGCSSLIALILRGGAMSGIGGSGGLTGTAIANGTGYIYVPRSLIDTYISNTTWGKYVTPEQFRALEDYTVDGTIEGELAVYGVYNSLTKVSTSNADIMAYGSYNAVLSPEGERQITSVVVTMGGVDITEEVYNHITGEINIPTVTGSIRITASAKMSIDGGTYLYKLQTPTTFNGTSDYIDTGIALFDTPKSFTIICKADFTTLAKNIALFHCMRESAPYPGLAVDGNSGVRVCYSGSSSLTTSIGAVKTVAAIAIRYKDGVLDLIKYKGVDGSITTVTYNSSATYIEVTQNLLLGAYQSTAGVKGRYYNGTISIFDVYDGDLSETEIDDRLALT